MTVGQQLQQVRANRKLSFADVTAATKIQPWVLEALESDRLPELMSPVYVKGFLSTYARFLKLDPAPLVAGLQWPQPPEQDEVLLQQQELPPASVTAKKAAVAVAEAPAAKPQLHVPNVRLPAFQMPRFQLPTLRLPRIPMPVLWRVSQAAALAFVIALVLAVKPLQHAKKIPWPTLSRPLVAKTDAGAKKAAARKQTAKKPASAAAVKVRTAKAAEEVKPAAPKLASASVAPVGEALKSPPPPPVPVPVSVEPLELVVTANRTTWIRIRADGKLLTQQRLARGANERWTAKRQFEVVVSKPSQVELTLNGQSISPFAIAHRGRLLITHRGVTPLPGELQD
ncbi:MAG: hypothetical protein A3B78_04030 [Omnitrophica WOR_2 bacterium RIFCSPHIGHO2_02_FULL_67_20]|nr:MAG: hypothetical protein A3B78_04030 [Omnitrophica WOR_2 bacterium RIFCSPHIGHO2_02_FULL_67_20]